MVHLINMNMQIHIMVPSVLLTLLVGRREEHLACKRLSDEAALA